MSAAENQQTDSRQVIRERDEVQRYIHICHQNVEEQADAFFSMPHLLEIQKKCLKKDILKSLVNVFYAPAYVIFKDFAFWCSEMGWNGPHFWLTKIPPSLPTQMHYEVESFIKDKIFQLPTDSTFSTTLPEHSSSLSDSMSVALHQEVRRFTEKGTEKSDLHVSFVSLLLGFLFFQKNNFSLSQMSENLAQFWAQEKAASEFALGEGAGRFFYSLFPTDPSGWQILFSTLLVLAVFAALVHLLNLTLVLLQIHFRFYRRRLHELVDQIEDRLLLKVIKPTTNKDAA